MAKKIEVNFANRILTWFDQYGRKHLPWQQNRSAYTVWLSEIMLQQTQVATVIPYFEKFMAHFPTIETLANASLDEVLSDWAGLGYYSRARNLHKTAQIIQQEYEGKFPRQLEWLEKMPGIGRSTAGAILAQAFNQFGVILDGNVRRVLCRFHAVTEPVNQVSTQKQLWKFAIEHTPKERLADYTQAMMDLGAMICTRSKAKCAECPLQKNCEAYRLNQVDALPVKIKPKVLPVQEKYFLIIKNKQQQILLERQPEVGIWGGLWSLPSALHLDLLETHLQVEDFLPEIKHTFSHYKLILKPVIMMQNKATWGVHETNATKWVALDELKRHGLPAPIKKILWSIYALD